MNEHQHQCALIDWAKMLQGQIPELWHLFSIPNGGWRHPATARRLKAEGLRAGIPDLQLTVARQGYHGLFIEMKYGKNRPTEAQWKRISGLISQGYAVYICYSWEEAKAAIEDYLGIKED